MFRKVGGLIAFALCFALVGIQIFRNAWVADDAFITLRTVEQVLAGNGPRWNPHERVQAFTHPLWMLLIVPIRYLMGNAYLSVLTLSFSCTAITLVLLWSASGRRAAVAIGMCGLLVSSKAFVEYSTSGLENPLSHFLLVIFFLSSSSIIIPRGPDSIPLLPLFSSSLMFITRPDLVLLTIPAMCLLTAEYLRSAKRPYRLQWVMWGLSPAVLWISFSLFYYGFPFPNTFYAKTGSGFPAWELIAQGYRYLQNSLSWDPCLLGWTAVALIAGCLSRRRIDVAYALGIATYLCYVVRIGGDFMSGRFMTPAFVLAVLATSTTLPLRFFVGASAITFGVSTLNSASPVFIEHLTSRLVTCEITRFGIADERACYAPNTGLPNLLSRSLSFPESGALETGRIWRALHFSQREIPLASCIGMTGFASGTEPIIVDRFGLSDPLLARLPALRPWRIGHFSREIPSGYFESLKSGTNKVDDLAMARLYESLMVVTQGPLLSWKRLRAILALNLGPTRYHALPDTIPRVGTLNWGFEDGKIPDAPWSLQTSPALFNPVTSSAVGQQTTVTGYVGRFFFNSFDPVAGDGAIVSLRLPPFQVTSPALCFLVGGGQDIAKLSVSLRSENDQVLKAVTGTGLEHLTRRCWGLTPWMGQSLTLKIEDLSAEAWGHILVDDIHFSSLSLQE